MTEKLKFNAVKLSRFTVFLDIYMLGWFRWQIFVYGTVLVMKSTVDQQMFARY